MGEWWCHPPQLTKQDHHHLDFTIKPLRGASTIPGKAGTESQYMPSLGLTLIGAQKTRAPSSSSNEKSSDANQQVTGPFRACSQSIMD
jgi:hypothetical protein